MDWLLDVAIYIVDYINVDNNIPNDCFTGKIMKKIILKLMLVTIDNTFANYRDEEKRNDYHSLNIINNWTKQFRSI